MIPIAKTTLPITDIFKADFWRYLLKAIWLFFPPLIFLLAAYACFWKLTQGKDLMVISIEYRDQNSFIYTILALVFWSYVTWYSSRLVAKTKFFQQSDNNYFWAFFLIHGPRIMAYACFSIVILAYFQLPTSAFFLSKKVALILLLVSLSAYFLIYYLWDKFTDKKKDESPEKQLAYLNRIRIRTYLILLAFTLVVMLAKWFWGMILLFVALQIGLVLLLIIRRKRVEILNRSTGMASLSNENFKMLKNLWSKLKVLLLDAEDRGYFMVFIALSVLVAIVYLMTVFSVPFSVRLGSFPFVLLAFGILLLLGNTVAVISIIKRFNFHLLLFILAVIIGNFFEPHYTFLPEKQKKTARFDQRQNLREYFSNWVNQPERKKILQDSSIKSYPVYFVLSNGGASRAGYWVASVLANLEDTTRGEFSKHLFCLSGASGGSVGNAAFFCALRAKESLIQHDKTDSANLHAVKDYLRSDFLTYTLARMLGPDVFRHIFPLRFIDDRAAALARAIEQAPGEKSFLYDSMASGFSNFITQKNQPNYSLPVLCINTTRMQEGNPGVISNIDISDRAFNRRVDVLDLLDETKDMKLSTAVVLGASFPYVSPAGRIDRIIPKEKTFLQKKDSLVPNYFVDGGYFDNSGAGIVNEMIVGIKQMVGITKDSSLKRSLAKLEFYVIHITNDPLGEPILGTVNPLVNDLAAPVKTLIGSYGTQTTINDLRLKNYMNSVYNDDTHYQQAQLYINRDSIVFPMNWVISDHTRGIMDIRLRDNDAIKKIKSMMLKQLPGK